MGRVGGDEFAVFLKNADESEVAATAERLLELYRKLFTEDKVRSALSCSIGGARYPADGRDFRTLYRHADRALYAAKSEGKNRFRLYSPDMGQMDYSSLGAEIDSDSKTSDGMGSFPNYIFDILYATDDLYQAVDLILEIVGKRFDVSRVYIFENSESGLSCDNTFEWCNEDVAPEKDSLQNVVYGDLGNYESLFDADGVFFCRDVGTLQSAQADFLANQNIRSVLQCKILDGDRFWGFVGFDECTGLRMWTQDEINILTLTAKLLSTFLIKRRAQDRDRLYGERLDVILNLQDAYLYVVQKDTFVLRYLNQKTKELDADARTGTPCYRAFFGRDTPCEQCPVKELGKSLEIRNPCYNVWTRAYASPLDWDGEAYLVSCYDITKYVK